MQEKCQSGRSLVEMLGSLAVMGVLTLGAIGGYNYALSKARANRLFDEAKGHAVQIAGTHLSRELPETLSLQGNTMSN